MEGKKNDSMINKELVENFIRQYIKEYKVITRWREPVISFADANDPLFWQLKNIIDKSHNTPNELLPKAKTVIAYFIPFNSQIVLSNSKGKISSREWAIAYVETNKLIIELNNHISKLLGERKFDSKILPPTHNFDKKKLISYWSHKHVAYIAGLGKFGLHKMLITDMGCCGRLGSLITTAEFKPTERTNVEYCLFYYNKTCKKCVELCSFNALRLEEFNRDKCYEICLENGRIYHEIGLTDICGKCVCNVPCSFKNPIQT